MAEGEILIAQQHGIIASLERDGLDVSEVKAVLLQIEELQGMLFGDRDRLKKELAEKYPQIPTYLYQLDLLSFWSPGEKLSLVSCPIAAQKPRGIIVNLPRR